MIYFRWKMATRDIEMRVTVIATLSTVFQRGAFWSSEESLSGIDL